MRTKQTCWGIVLAGGEGSRVQTFLAALCGGRGIKQYCAVLGRHSLLQRTLLRVERLIPRERIIVIVDSRHRAEAAAQLAHLPADNILYQPANRETAPGILLPLAHVMHRDPTATVAVFPSDHFVLDERKFVQWIGKALTEAEQFPEQALLLGMTPARMEEGYGWIQCGGSARPGRSRPVVCFREKPSREEAQRFMAQGALWNTFVFTGRGRAIWEMARLAIPDIWNAFETIRQMLSAGEAKLYIEEIYRNLRSANFSTEVLTRMTSKLRVMAVPEVGWSDWGSVERILASASDLGRLHEITTRLRDVQLGDPATEATIMRFIRTSSGGALAGPRAADSRGASRRAATTGLPDADKHSSPRVRGEALSAVSTHRPRAQ